MLLQFFCSRGDLAVEPQVVALCRILRHGTTVPQPPHHALAGVAAAFASPIGGVLFTIEEGVSFYSTSVFWRGFLATCVAVLTLHFLVELTVRQRHFLAAEVPILVQPSLSMCD